MQVPPHVGHAAAVGGKGGVPPFDGIARGDTGYAGPHRPDLPGGPRGSERGNESGSGFNANVGNTGLAATDRAGVIGWG